MDVDRLLSYFLSEPRRLIALGQVLAQAGGLLLVFGAIGHLATTATSAIQSFGSQAVAPRMLAEVYPSLPTWWIPESIIGCLPAIALLIVGIVATQTGRQFQRAGL